MKKKKNTRQLFRFLGVLLITVSILVTFVFIAPNISGDNDKNVYLLVPDNSIFETLTNNLTETGVVRSMLTFKIAALIIRYGDNIKPGRYELQAGMNNLRLIHNLQTGRQTALNLTFNNIRTKNQLAGRLSKQIMADSASICKLMNDSVYLETYGFNPNTVLALFIPDTYEVFWDMDANELFERMEKEYSRFWNETRREKAANIPMNPIEVSTLASIVEEETNNKTERPMVAGLYINRLKTKMPLQADPTVKFAYGDFTLRRITGEQLRINSPYNTYKNKGLPPGPIRLATASGIDAVLNYEKHNYIFMCAKETLNGEHNFAVTYPEHQRNAKKYQKALDERKIFK